MSSRTSTPGTSGRWLSSPSQLSIALEMESWAGRRDIPESQTLSRTVSLGANSSDFEHPRQKAEPAYSFVGMHCIFDECKSMVTVIKFGHMSSDILAYGATDGTITVCTVSEPPSIMKKLTGQLKDVTDILASQTRVDTRKNGKTEVKSSRKQSDSNSLRSIKSTWKDMLGQKRRTSFNIADFIAQRKEEESKVDDTNHRPFRHHKQHHNACISSS